MEVDRGGILFGEKFTVRFVVLTGSLLLLLLSTSCQSETNQFREVYTTNTPIPLTNTSLALSTPEPAHTPPPSVIPSVTASPTWEFRPTSSITATPFWGETKEDITHTINKLLSDRCIIFTLDSGIIDVGTPQFVEISNPPDPNSQAILEIADSYAGSYQAYIVAEPVFCEVGHCFQDKIYVQDRVTGQVYQINWDNYISWRPIWRAIWIGNDVLLFSQSSNPHTSEFIGISMKTHSFVYYSLVRDCYT